MATNKYFIYEIDISHINMGDLKTKIANINKIQFGGQSVLKLSNNCTFDYDYSDCYYESDPPRLKIVIPYLLPKSGS